MVLGRLRGSCVSEQTWPLGRHGCGWLAEWGCVEGIRATGYITCPVFGPAAAGSDRGHHFLLAGTVAVLSLPCVAPVENLICGIGWWRLPWSCPSWRHRFRVPAPTLAVSPSSVDRTCGGLRRLKTVLLCSFVVCLVVVGVVCQCPAPLYLALGMCVECGVGVCLYRCSRMLRCWLLYNIKRGKPFFDVSMFSD